MSDIILRRHIFNKSLLKELTFNFGEYLNNILYIQRILTFHILLDLHFLLCTLSIPIIFIQIYQRKFHELEIFLVSRIGDKKCNSETFVNYIEKKGALI